MNLLTNVKISEVNAPVANANNTDDNSDILDMSGFDGVVFIVAITDCVQGGVATLTAQGNDANSDSGMAALAGASAAATSAGNDDLNDTLLIVDVFRPRDRYIQATLTSATQNIAFSNTIAIQYGPSKAPITQPASVTTSALAVSPADA